MMIAVASALHVLSAVLWVGGMFFAYHILRPSVGDLEPPARLRLWRSVFQRFFRLVIVLVILLPLTGYILLFGLFGGFAESAVYVHLMHALGWVMIGLFALLYLRFWPRFYRAVDQGDFPAAAVQLAAIRRVVASNLGLGLLVIVIAAAGRYWP